MGPALRRSRRSTPKKVSSYNVGDIVEINRGGRFLIGRLAYNLTEAISPNPRWLVTFENETHKDEELYEKALGKILKKATGDKDKNFHIERRARLLPSSNVDRRHGQNSGSSEEGECEKKKKSKSVAFSDAGTPAQSDDSSTDPKKSSAREQRSRRRQAKIDDVVVSVPNGSSQICKRRLPSSSRATTGKNSNSITKKTKDGEVVKVKLLTGTLYLYRGLHRRAEFIRRI
mmetsp:Transcript_7913/g.9061  ORF Transcript_7913/g.9061 Transcript_7913/m.9061 type:complete len:230 (-) Transcript_7913:141-830(-)